MKSCGGCEHRTGDNWSCNSSMFAENLPFFCSFLWCSVTDAPMSFFSILNIKEAFALWWNFSISNQLFNLNIYCSKKLHVIFYAGAEWSWTRCKVKGRKWGRWVTGEARVMVVTVWQIQTILRVCKQVRSRRHLGTHSPSKTDEFSEKFQTAFDPPPPLIFGKLYCNFFLKFRTEVSSIMAKI